MIKISMNDIKLRFNLAEETVFGRQCPVSIGKDGNYYIRIIFKKYKNTLNNKEHAWLDQFVLDNNKVIIRSPRGYNGTFKENTVVEDVVQYIENWK